MTQVAETEVEADIVALMEVLGDGLVEMLGENETTTTTTSRLPTRAEPVKVTSCATLVSLSAELNELSKLPSLRDWSSTETALLALDMSSATT